MSKPRKSFPELLHSEWGELESEVELIGERSNAKTVLSD